MVKGALSPRDPPRLLLDVPAWLAGLLLLPLAFSVWSTSLIVSVARLRTDVEVDVGLTGQLGKLEQDVRALETTLPDADAPASQSRPSWPQLRSHVDDRRAGLEAEPHAFQAIAADMRRFDALVAELDTTYRRVLESSLGDPSRLRLEGEFRATETRAIDTIKVATALVRVQLTSISETLGAKWTQLNIVAGSAVLLAFAFAGLLIFHERALRERKRLDRALRETQAEVKQLQGILPICSYCKRIRDDKNFWQQVDTYVSAHSDATFTHGVCPSCYERVISAELDDRAAH